VLALAAGCGDSLPKTYPVKGWGVYKGKGGDLQWLAYGTVRCQSAADPKLTGQGTIEEDATFALGTYFEEKGVGGVPAGEYKVRVEPPEVMEGKSIPGILHPKYRSFDKSGLTITVPVSGEVVRGAGQPVRAPAWGVARS
jgi:hypothetical protein